MGDATTRSATGESQLGELDAEEPVDTEGPVDAGGPADAEGPVFVVSTNDLSFVQGNTEAHYVSRLFGERFETHVFAPLSADLPGVKNHPWPFGGVLGVVALNLLFLPYWLYIGWRVQPNVVYCYGNVVVPPFAIRAVTDAVVVHDLQCDPYDQMTEFAEEDGSSKLLRPFIEGVRLAHRFALPRSDAVVTLSDHLARKVRDNYGVAPENIHVVPLGVDTDTFAPDVESTLEPTDRLRIAYLGTIRHYRGLDTVVEGLALLDSDQCERVQFDVFGAGDEEFIRTLREEAEKVGVELVYHGHVAHDEVPAALAGCDLATSPLPPLDSYLVSSPAKVFEYLAAGLPILATRIPPHERYLTDGVDALLFDSEDPETVAESVTRVLDDPDALSRMSENARRTALDHDWTDRFERIAGVVAAAQAGRASRGAGGRRRGRTGAPEAGRASGPGRERERGPPGREASEADQTEATPAENEP